MFNKNEICELITKMRGDIIDLSRDFDNFKTKAEHKMDRLQSEISTEKEQNILLLRKIEGENIICGICSEEPEYGGDNPTVKEAVEMLFKYLNIKIEVVPMVPEVESHFKCIKNKKS